jgi:hypothetical protein
VWCRKSSKTWLKSLKTAPHPRRAVLPALLGEEFQSVLGMLQQSPGLRPSIALDQACATLRNTAFFKCALLQPGVC